MTTSTHSRLLAVLLAVCVIHLFFLAPNAWKAAEGVWMTRGMSNVERRLLQKGNWFPRRRECGSRRSASHRSDPLGVSSAPPWYLVYYLYPRLLRLGSESPADREAIQAGSIRTSGSSCIPKTRRRR